MNLADKYLPSVMTWEELNTEILELCDARLAILNDAGGMPDDEADRRLDALFRREASLRSARATMAIDLGRMVPMSERLQRIAERNRNRAA